MCGHQWHVTVWRQPDNQQADMLGLGPACLRRVKQYVHEQHKRTQILFRLCIHSSKGEILIR